MNIGIIFAGGTGIRMQSKERPKQFLEMYGKPIIVYTIEHFERCADIDAIIIACLEEWIPYMEKLIAEYELGKIVKVVKGGQTVQLSIYNALIAAKDYSGDEDSIVVLHDGVRPLINDKLITANINCVKENGSAITTSYAPETVVITDEKNEIIQVPNRARAKIARAPQSFWLKDILEAHEKAQAENMIYYIDSCTMMQHYGYKLTMIEGPHENLKITTPEDFYMMRAILDSKETAQMYGYE
ncbi:MAG: IspD/TarI family cytidylyltransferase [Lachnospiraceae bacterium]|nr:IspD/TarI family cytidylyltransferase [Lachnospiraceae bacterium]